jgi:hypothetical protein
MLHIRPAIFLPHHGITAAHSTRHGGVSPAPLGMNVSFRVGDHEAFVQENRKRFLRSVGMSENLLAVPRQIHSATVRAVEWPGQLPDCDGLTTNVPGVVLSVTVADCLAILLADPARGVVAAVHAGWRGTASGIATRAVELLQGHYGVHPADLLVYLGPSARACCYEVGEDVASLFGDAVIRRDQKRYLDLAIANEQQLTRCGVSPGNIETSPDCTISHPELYHSYRRDGGRSGRMMAVIGILPLPA